MRRGESWPAAPEPGRYHPARMCPDDSSPSGRKGPMSAERRALLARLLAQKGLRPAAAPKPIERRSESGPVPLSFAQEALWFLDQLEPQRALHNQPGAVRLTGRLDVPALERSLAEIIRRHEPLRTRIVAPLGQPRQIVCPPGPFSLPMTDLSDRPPDEALTQARRLLVEDAHTPFDLETGPLRRFALLRLGPAEHVLIVTFHHIVTDGWSMGVFTRELQALYPAFLAGQPSPLEELPIQFADFALWQRETMQGETLERHLAYWRQRLAGAAEGVTLPPDHERPPVQSFRGRHQPVSLSAGRSEELRALSRRLGVTLFVTLKAAFDVLLHAATGATDVVTGSAVAHRNQKELEGLIAFLVNMLALRADLSGNPSFDELARRVQRDVLGAWSHQDLPLTRILREVQPGRDLSKNPLFQVQFSLLTPDVNPAVYGYGLEMGAIERVELPGLVMTPMEVPYDNARYDVAVFLWDLADGIRGTIEYSRDLYEPATMKAVVERYEALLAAVVRDPGQPLAQLVAGLAVAEQEARAAAEATFEESLKKRLGGLRRRRQR